MILHHSKKKNVLRVDRLNSVSPIVWFSECIFYLVLYVFYITLQGIGSAQALRIANVLGPVLLILISMYGCILSIRTNRENIWTALFWFRVAAALYFGIGQIVPFITEETTLRAIYSLYVFSDEECLRFNQVIAIGMACVLFGASFCNWTFGTPRAGTRTFQLRINHLGWLFFIIGGLARYGLYLPFALGLQDGILAGVVSNISKIYAAGIMLLAIHSITNKNLFLLFFVFICSIVDIISGILLFNKSEIMLTILFLSLAIYSQIPRISLLLGIIFISLSVFIQIVPVVNFGRDSLAIHGNANIGTFEQRISIVDGYFTDGRFIDPDEGNYFGLMRFSYTNAGTLVMNLYDSDIPQSTIQNVAAAFVPRMLWPNKPNLSAQGTQLYTLATGQVGSSISPTLFGEAYGNFGWLGIPLMMIPYGLMLATLSRCLAAAIAREEWFMLPAVLMGMVPGIRIDGSYAMDVVGGPLTTLVIIVVSFKIFRWQGR